MASITQAQPGWRAVFARPEGREGFFTSAVACWALCQIEDPRDASATYEEVLPVCQLTPEDGLGPVHPDEFDFYLGVAGPDEDIDQMYAAAAARYRERRGTTEEQ